MAFHAADRVKETTTTTGTGTLNLGGTVAQYQTFVAGIGTGNTCNYCIIDGNGVDWETGTGTVTDATPDTLSRTTVYASTNSGSKISLSSGNTHVVICTAPGEHVVASKDLDNGFTSTQGSILYRGSAGWAALGTGTSGNVLTTHGAAADPSWDAPGGGGGGTGLFSAVLSTTPTQSSTGLSSWLNQPASSTVTDASIGVVVYKPSQTGNTLAILQKTPPATPYNVTALIASTATMFTPSASGKYGGAAFGFSDGTKTVSYQYNLDIRNSQPGPGWLLSVQHYSLLNGFTASTVGGSWFYLHTPIWLRIRDDGTNIKFYYSSDGLNFIECYTEARGSYLSSPSKIVWGAWDFGSPSGVDVYSSLLSWAVT